MSGIVTPSARQWNSSVKVVEANTTGTVSVLIGQHPVKDTLRCRYACARRSRRLRQLARLVLENPSVLHCPSAVSEALRITKPNAKTLLSRYGKLTGNEGNRLCLECLAIMTISSEGLTCTNCGYEQTMPRIVAPPDLVHEIQSEIWGVGTEMTASELKKVAPRLKTLFYTNQEKAKKQVLSDLEEVLKSLTLTRIQTTWLAQRALFYFKILVNERGKLRAFKSVALSLLDGACMNPLLSLALRDYVSNGPYYTRRKPKKRK